MSDFWERYDSRVRELRVAAGMTPEPTWRERFVDWWSSIEWSFVGFIVCMVGLVGCETVALVAKLMLIKMGRADLVH
jgi:hypothetical protein